LVLGPSWPTASRSSPLAAGSAELTAAVQEAAHNLVMRLQEAERHSAGWTDQGLAYALVDAAMSRCFHQLASTGCWSRDNQLPSDEFWKIAGPPLETSWLQHRARFKPRGYAGDYEMLSRICTGQVCEHPLGRLFDRYFLNQAAPQAVRARTEQIGHAIATHCLTGAHPTYRVVSVGSGPALDIRRAVEVLPSDVRCRLHVTLLDLDDDALQFASQGLLQFLSAEQVTCHRNNLYRLPAKARAAALLDAADFIVCSGFFDYLEPAPAAAMLKAFWTRLAPGGMLLVGNFAPHNTTQAYMEWLGNWYLLYRTAEEMAQLARDADIPHDQFHVSAERLGVVLFLHAWKT
jgi:extracellular factor (EF) 3-hydroxypalmitic acid methyl ester biosynthesis protein